MMEVCEDSRFFFGQADLLLAYLDTLHQKGHVAAKVRMVCKPSASFLTSSAEPP